MLINGIPVEPDVTALAVEWLTVQLPRVGVDVGSVSSAVPANRPESFVVVKARGGPEVSLTTRSYSVTAQVYDVNEERAVDAALKTVALLKAAPGYKIAGFTYVQRARKSGGPVDWPDPDIRDVTRIQVVVDWTIRLA